MNLLLNIDVPDLADAEAFYVAAFGLEPARRFGSDMLEMLGAPVLVYLLRKPDGSAGAALQARDYARHWTPVHCDLVVDHLESALARALAAGARQEGAIRTAAWGRIVQLADPFGHGWCVIEFSSSGYDAIASPP